MNLVRIPAPLFNLRLTLESGQVFHWVAVENGGVPTWSGVIDGRPVAVGQCREEELWVTPGEEERVARYFALDHPLEEIYASFPDDPTMREAVAACRGIRVIRQPLWECLGTFITSSMKQVKHIQQMSHALRSRWGRPLPGPVAAYPEPAMLAMATEEEVRACGLGFRAKGLLGTARAVAERVVDLEAIRGLDDDAARAALCQLPGVGVKIANCVLLFGYERVRAFPIDVWIERVLVQRYLSRKRKLTPERLERFAADYFGPYGGYAQQYLFHHARIQPRSNWK